MKKAKSLIKYITLISMLFLFLGLAACKNGGDSSLGGGKLPPLKTPENVYLSLNQTADGKTEFIVDWDKVKNAYEYRVKLNGKTLSTIKTECDVTQCVISGKITLIEVWALGIRGEYSSSQRATLTCTPKEVSKGLLYTAVDGGYQVCGEANIDGVDLVLPDTYLGKPIIKIEDNAFIRNKKSKNFKTVRLPMHVNYIGDYAFGSFVNLKELVIPPKVKTIGECAFAACEKLTSVDLANVENLVHGCFEGCDLREVFVPKTVKILGPAVFASNKNLANVVLEDGMNIEEYGEEVFSSTAITSIPKDLPVITEGMFTECNALTDVYIPDTVKRVEAKAFSSCNNMKSLHIPASVEYLSAAALLFLTDNVEVFHEPNPYIEFKDEYIISKDGKRFIYYFERNTGENFTVPSTVEIIGEYAFGNAKNLKQISMPDTITVIEDYAFQWSGLTSVDLPDNLEKLGTNVFDHMKGISEVEIPKGVTCLPEGTFLASRITHFVVPDHVTEIGSRVFYSCLNLEYVVLHKNLTSVDNVQFGRLGGLLEILPNIFFKGTEAELDEMMQKGILSEEFFYEYHMFGYGRKIPVYYYSEEEPPKMVGGNYDNNYWHYDENGNPVIWEIEK